MSKRAWAQEAIEVLKTGQRALVKPKGHSMRGEINDGDSVIIAPCRELSLAVGDIVLARIKGRRHSHLVLHLLVARDGDKFLIGNNFGRFDGWVRMENIFGKVHEIHPATPEQTRQDGISNEN